MPSRGTYGRAQCAIAGARVDATTLLVDEEHVGRQHPNPSLRMDLEEAQGGAGVLVRREVGGSRPERCHSCSGIRAMAPCHRQLPPPAAGEVGKGEGH
jgi:hypothetical protein